MMFNSGISRTIKYVLPGLVALLSGFIVIGQSNKKHISLKDSVDISWI
jgi:hypothetical protein